MKMLILVLLLVVVVVVVVIPAVDSSGSVPQAQPSYSSMSTRHGSCGTEKCGAFDPIPFPFHLDASCESFSGAFRLFCSHSTSSLFLSIGSQSYKVLHFFPYGSGVLVDFPNASSTNNITNYPTSSSSCFPGCYDLSSFSGLERNDYFGVSGDNVLSLYGCHNSSLFRADCNINFTMALKSLPTPSTGCENHSNINTATTQSCCYPLSSNRSIWHLEDGFSVFSQFGCKGLSSWVRSGSSSAEANAAGPRCGIKLEWAVSNNLIQGACDSNSRLVNATTVVTGMRCQCLGGFVGDGFADGLGCLKSCPKDGEETYNRDCYVKGHGRRKLLLVVGIITSGFSTAVLTVLFFLLKRPSKFGEFDRELAHGQSRVLFPKGSRTRLFTYHELDDATKGFGVDHGNGGRLYAGILGNGSPVVVHKVHCASERDLIQVLSQVEVLSQVSHRNVARVLGCSIDPGYTPLVVYEYPANSHGTLSECLRQCREEKKGLEWHKRLNIAAQTASVLAFLQHEIFPPVMHHGLRSGCILLDEDLSIKIAGFELVIRADGDGRNENDVYSLGVVLLEIIAGGRLMDLPNSTLDLQGIIRSGKLEEIVDPLLYYHEQPGFRKEQIDTVADLATRCLLFGMDGKLGMDDVARELVQIMKETSIIGGNNDGGSRRGPSLEETFSNSSLLQMISMSPDSIYVPYSYIYDLYVKVETIHYSWGFLLAFL